MKLTNETLKRIIKEELEAVLGEEQLPSELSNAMPVSDPDFEGLQPGQFKVSKSGQENIGDVLYVMTKDGQKKYAGNLNKKMGRGQQFDNAGNPITVYAPKRQRADISKKALLNMGYEEV